MQPSPAFGIIGRLNVHIAEEKVMRKWIILAALSVAFPAMAADVGLIKVSKGSVQIQRSSVTANAAVASAR